MKKVGEIYDKDGKVSRIMFKDESGDNYIIQEVNQEVDKDQNIINTVTLCKVEYDRLHNAMRRIKEY